MEELEIKTAFLVAKVNDFIETTSKVYQIPKDMVTAAVYMAAAVAAGNRITTFDGIYTNKLSLWGITVGISGAGKSQYAYKVFQPILKRNDILIEEDEAVMKKWDRKGEEPVQHDFRMHSATLEAVLKKLSDNPDGIFYFRPELSGWVGSFGKYNRDDTEYSSWIELWDGKTFPIHTKTGETKFINCKDPVLSVFGGVQPHILKRFANKDIVGTGFLGRLLIVFPKLNYPSCPPEETLDDKLLCFWEDLIKTIYSTNTQFLFSTEAKEIYNEYCYKYILDKLLVFEELTTDPYELCMREFYGKIKVYVEKWAGISMLLAGKSGFIDAEIMQEAVDAMKVMESYAQKAYGFTFGRSEGSGKGTVIRNLNKYFPIKNQSQFADSIGISRSLVNEYLHAKK